jgi:antitoxin component of RelBE/YafQ-DinJ toxin-antitoxin module
MASNKVQEAKDADKPKPGILHIRLDQELLDDSQALAKELGFNLSTHVRVLLRRALDERRNK